MLRRVYLHGAAAEQFGHVFELQVASLKEVAQALGALFPTFRKFLIANHFRVVAGPSLERGIQLGEKQIDFALGRRDIHIVPVTAGAKRAGVGKIIAGILIAVVAWWAAPALIPAGFMGGAGSLTIAGINSSTIAMLGVSMALSGASQLLAPKQKKQQSNSTEAKPSFVFNGAVNNTEQGGCVPLIYGQTMVGSTVISAGMTTDDIPT